MFCEYLAGKFSFNPQVPHTGKCIRRFGGTMYLRVLPVLHRPDVVDIGVNTI